MNGNAGTFITSAHPEIVGSDRSYLGNKQVSYPLITHAVYRLERRKRVAHRHKKLRLQFLAAARREIHTKVRQAFVPWTGDTHLLSAIFRREFGDRMKVFLRLLCA